MRITVQVACEDVEDAKRVIAKLAAPDNTWVEQIDKPVSTARLDKIMESKPVPKVDARPNINPGDPTIGKIGEATKATILGDLDGCQGLPKYTEHLKLLWKRGLVKYDGEEYYL